MISFIGSGLMTLHRCTVHTQVVSFWHGDVCWGGVLAGVPSLWE